MEFFFYGKDIFKLNFNNLDKLIIVFFTYTIFTGILNNFYFQSESLNEDFTIITKSLLYIRFLFLYFVIRILINNELINFKFFFIFCFICAYFVALDLIYQLNFGKDIFGYVSPETRRLSGPFGDELIAGSYLQRFSLFALFLLPIFFKNKSKTYLYLLSLLTFVLIMVGLIIAGNRMPLILFIIMITCVLSFSKPMRKFLFLFLLLSTVALTTLWHFNSNIKSHFNAFVGETARIIKFAAIVVDKDKEIKYVGNKKYRYTINVNGEVIPLENVYIKEFLSGYLTWLENKYLGGGIKSFRYNCVVSNCNSHPHNYYLEILSDLGLIGFFLILTLFSIVLFKSFFGQQLTRSSSSYDKIIVPFMFLFLVEIFPIKSTGSFFTTGNATYLFLIMSITVALSQVTKKKI